MTRVLICISLMISDGEHFLITVGYLHVFRKMSIQILFPFLNQVACFFSIELYELTLFLGANIYNWPNLMFHLPPSRY